MNGGFDTTRSNRRPSTGASRSPSISSQCSPLRRAVRRAIASARGRTSVPVTVPACCDRCKAWTPQPVPMSSAVPTGRRTVAEANVREARADAEHVIRSYGAGADVGAEVGDHPPLLVRSEVDRGAVAVAVRLQQDRGDRRGGRERECGPNGGGRLGRAEQEQADQRLQRRAAGGGAQSWDSFTTGQGAGRLLAEQVHDGLGGVAGGAEGVGQPVGICVRQERVDPGPASRSSAGRTGALGGPTCVGSACVSACGGWVRGGSACGLACARSA